MELSALTHFGIQIIDTVTLVLPMKAAYGMYGTTFEYTTVNTPDR